MKKDILTLGIESSCDETSVSVVKNGREILSNVIDTQIPIHEKYGGVVPEIASRNHIEAISRVTKKALEEANVKFEDIDAITPTYGPGLVGALLVGLSYAKALSFAINKPLVGVNHIQGHIAANYITYPELKPPFLCVMTSGGNTQLIHVKNYTEFEVLVKPCAEHLYAAPVLFDGNTVAVTGELPPFVVISYFVCGEVGIILDVFHSDGEGCPCTFQGKRSLYPGTEFFVQVVVPPSKLRMVVAHVETRIQVLDECTGCQLYGIFKQPEIQVGPAFHIELPDIFSEQRHFARHVVV